MISLVRGALGLCLSLTLGCSSDADDGAGSPPGQGGSAASQSGSAGAMSSAGGTLATGGNAGTSGGAPATGGSGQPNAGGVTNGGSSGQASIGGQAGLAGSAGSASGGAGGASGGMGGSGGERKSAGCTKPRALQDGTHTVQSGGVQRTYTLRAPANYDNTHPYRLILGFHGANGKSSDIAPSYFGLWDLSQGSTIFAAPDAVGGLWKADADTTMVGDLLEQLENGLCIDASRVEIEGFSQGGAMVWTLACALPETFRLAIVHSGGGLAMPKTCQPLPFFSSLGNDGSGQGMSSDFFAMTNGCTVESAPMPPAGGHTCIDYKGCSAGHPTRWCDYDGGHTPAPVDTGKGSSWMPQEVWNFVKQF